MIINDLDGYYIVFDTKNWNTELDTLFFLGYFFPGAFALLIIWSSYIVWTKEDILPISYLYDSIGYYSNGKSLDLVKIAVPFILCAYILGHLISYLSAITIEFFTNKAFGYPSLYLLSNQKKKCSS